MHKPWTLDSIKKAIGENMNKTGPKRCDSDGTHPAGFHPDRCVACAFHNTMKNANISRKTKSVDVHKPADLAINQHMAKMQAEVNVMPLGSWLHAIRQSIPWIGKDHAMREFVTGLHKRELIYHWDDCAIDCLGHKIEPQFGAAINQIVKELYCEDMFTLAMQLLEESEEVDAVEIFGDKRILGKIADAQGNALGVHSCFCDIKDLATHGCKCGGC